MPKYQVFLSKTATKQLDKLPNSAATPILNAIKALADNPRWILSQ